MRFECSSNNYETWDEEKTVPALVYDGINSIKTRISILYDLGWKRGGFSTENSGCLETERNVTQFRSNRTTPPVNVVTATSSRAWNDAVSMAHNRAKYVIAIDVVDVGINFDSGGVNRPVDYDFVGSDSAGLWPTRRRKWTSDVPEIFKIGYHCWECANLHENVTGSYTHRWCCFMQAAVWALMRHWNGRAFCLVTDFELKKNPSFWNEYIIRKGVDAIASVCISIWDAVIPEQ